MSERYTQMCYLEWSRQHSSSECRETWCPWRFAFIWYNFTSRVLQSSPHNSGPMDLPVKSVWQFLSISLQIIVMSATMDVDHFSQYFNNAPVLYLEGRQHPVKVFPLLLAFQSSPIHQMHFLCRKPVSRKTLTWHLIFLCSCFTHVSHSQTFSFRR